MTFHPVIPYGAGQHKSERELPEQGAPFVYTPDNRARFDEIVKRYPPDRRKSAILPALWLAQRQQGYITASVMAYVAEAIGCTAAEVEDVVSFYTMYYTKPMGKYIIQVCRTLSCALLGAERVTEELSQTLGIKPGETDAAREFSLLEVECLGACDRAPVVMVNEHGWHERLQPEDVGRLVDRIRAEGEKALSGCVHKIER
jgi:NADH-quinone oxidoreductase subunit E